MNKRPDSTTLRDALERTQGGRVSAMKLLRSQGYTGTTQWFLRRFSEIEDGADIDWTTSRLPVRGNISNGDDTEPASEASLSGGRAKPSGADNDPGNEDMVVPGDADEEGDDIEPAGYLQSADKSRHVLAAGRHVFTSAQSNTAIHQDFFDNLLSYCEMHDAELHIATYTYNKGSMGKKSVKQGSKKASDNDDLWYDPQIKPYQSDVSTEVAPGLIWCGELNILPTRINPLSSFKTYTRQDSAIIPHAKIAMESVPTMKDEPAKFLMSTGTVTLRNYIQKTSGQVADFHHVFGALVVDVAEDGTWWPRQINSDDEGNFYDLTLYYPAGGEPVPARVLAMNHGDIHGDKMDMAIIDTVFGEFRGFQRTKGLIDRLRPRRQFLHDTIDFMPRNHHNIKDPHFLHQMHVDGTEDVKAEFKRTADVIRQRILRSWCDTYVVESNHDMAIEGWLRNPEGQRDPVNVQTWHEWNAEACRVRAEGNKPRMFWHALSEQLPRRLEAHIDVLHEDQSLKVAGIEFGLHGHLGPNGARGNPKNLRTVGKANTGHTHSCGIVDGVYTAGVYGKLDMGYNKGLSSWSHSLVVTYANGKRAVLLIKNGKVSLDV